MPEAAAPLRAVRPWIWVLGFGATVVAASSLSALAYADALPLVVQETPHLDKVLHFSVAGVLAFFLDGALARRGMRVGPLAVPWSAVIVLVPAGIEEYLQRYTTHRTSSFWDFAADVAGVVVLTWVSRRLA
jgi:VanZ family protein